MFDKTGHSYFIENCDVVVVVVAMILIVKLNDENYSTDNTTDDDSFEMFFFLFPRVGFKIRSKLDNSYFTVTT